MKLFVNYNFIQNLYFWLKILDFSQRKSSYQNSRQTVFCRLFCVLSSWNGRRQPLNVGDLKRSGKNGGLHICISIVSKLEQTDHRRRQKRRIVPESFSLYLRLSITRPFAEVLFFFFKFWFFANFLCNSFKKGVFSLSGDNLFTFEWYCWLASLCYLRDAHLLCVWALHSSLAATTSCSRLAAFTGVCVFDTNSWLGQMFCVLRNEQIQGSVLKIFVLVNEMSLGICFPLDQF